MSWFKRKERLPVDNPKKASIRKDINSIIDEMDVEYTTDQHEVYSSTVGLSFDSAWYRIHNKSEIREKLIDYLNKL